MRITVLDTAGEIPLDFIGPPASGRPAAAGARSARAIVTSISHRGPSAGDRRRGLSATLTGVGTRRFANVLRVDLACGWRPPGRRRILSGDLTLRLVVGDDVLAPTVFPIAVIAGGATQRLTVEFEVPPDTTRAVLRATAGEARSEMPLTLR